MIRQNIKIGPHTYLAELYKYYELESEVTSTYSMLRNIVFTDYIGNDNDIYIIEDSLIDNNLPIIYPVSSSIEQFSTNINDFTNIYKPYKILDKSFNSKHIRCDKIRIYHPLTKVTNNDMIISIKNVINGVNFYFTIKLYDDCYVNSETEIKVNNDVYSEYIEFYIPSVEDIFSPTTYFIENTSTCKIDTSNINSAYTDVISQYNSLIQTDGTNIFCSMYLFNLQYNNANNCKTYIAENNVLIENLYMTYPITLVLYPFGEKSGDVYISNSELEYNLDVFVLTPKMSIICKPIFNSDGKFSIKLEFKYDEIYGKTFNSLNDAYEYYNSVLLSEYDNIYYENYDECTENNDQLIFSDENNKFYKQYQCIYKIILASDPEFKNIIYTSPNYNNDIYDSETDETNMNTLLNTIVNKEFAVPIFNSWSQIPETLLCKVTFTDRYIGSYIESNFILITKDYYKYLVNYETDYLEIYKFDEIMDKVNFYDKIVCNVKINEEPQSAAVNKGSVKTIYKPVFFKTQPLQNIQLFSGITQNIGINLANYLTKVNTFFIVIDNVKFIESGRNDVYVIFSIQGSKLKNTAGTYHIVNEEDEYISSGNWSII